MLDGKRPNDASQATLAVKSENACFASASSERPINSTTVAAAVTILQILKAPPLQELATLISYAQHAVSALIPGGTHVKFTAWEKREKSSKKLYGFSRGIDGELGGRHNHSIRWSDYRRTIGLASKPRAPPQITLSNWGPSCLFSLNSERDFVCFNDWAICWVLRLHFCCAACLGPGCPRAQPVAGIDSRGPRGSQEPHEPSLLG